MKKNIVAGAFALALAPVAASAQTPAPSTRDLAASCAICHGTNGINVGGMPTLAGQSKEALLNHLVEFRDGKRPATIMHQISKGYSQEQLETLAAYFAAQKLK